jgi:threonine/homoserine/homoserine lactone efflux protein
LFALSFCPTSAAIFFFSLIPLALQTHSHLGLPLFYGVGTALPVIGFAVLMVWSARSLGRAFQALSRVERWARTMTGLVFVGVGIWMSLKYIFAAI